jgi:serine protease Do
MHFNKMIKAFLACIGCVLTIMPASAHELGEREFGKAFIKVGRDAAPSVVFIHVEGRSSGSHVAPLSQAPAGGSPVSDDLLQQFIGEKSLDTKAPHKAGRTLNGRMVKSQGSGFIFTVGHAKSGKTYVLTSNHVVNGADKIKVQLKDGREFDAGVTGCDPQSDIAVLEIDATGLPALSLGDSSKLEVGEWVLAIGNPFGLNHTLTAGIVSAKGRTGLGINDYEDFIQIDAAINPGSAGGPLVNLKGKVVGINAAIFSRDRGYTGIGLAIPSNLAYTIAEQLVGQGKVTRGYLGVALQSLTSDLARSFNVPTGRGLLVTQVNKGSPAETAGLRQGDVILKVGNDAANNTGSFRNRVALMSPGVQVSMTILRDGEQQTLKVKVGQLRTEK